MDSLTELFCLIDDLCHQFEPALERHLLEVGVKKAQTPQRVELIGVNDLNCFVPSITISPVQEFLPDLRVPSFAG